MSEILEQTSVKFRNVLLEFFEKRPEITEIVLREGSRVFYMESGQWKVHDLGWEMADSEIDEYQKAIILEKVSGDGADERIASISRKLSEDGYFKYSYVINGRPYRINWSIGQGNSTMRIRRLELTVKPPNDLWIPDSVRKAVASYRSGGLIVFSAPPGNGKSTSIASLVQDLLRNECVNVVTLEDPIEYLYDQKSVFPPQQREIGTDLSGYDVGIESCMTSTPQIVVIQEMTTNEIIRSMMLLLKKGVMVITTLHSPDATSIFKNIADAFKQEEREAVISDLKNHFRCFVSQRLVPKSDGSWRTAVFEVLSNTDEVKGYVTEGATDRLYQIMDHEWHLSFHKAFETKIATGDISLETALEYCPYGRADHLKRILWYEKQ